VKLPGSQPIITEEPAAMANKSPKPTDITPTFFATSALFRQWLQKNHKSASELWVGFHKRRTGKPSITWPESVDQALCFGWIDGVRKSIDSESYVIRFTPRKTSSIWSAVNTKRARELTRLGLMQTAGAKAFARRDADKTNRYSLERDHAALNATQKRIFRANHRAWEFFQSQPPWYRKITTLWVVSAKQDATQLRRLATLIADSDAGRRIGLLRR
jgi:uncharacterized protein YdeI (YjbR/CyaY-like superfamily)